MDDWDVECRIILPTLFENEQRAERFETADHHQRMEVVLLELRCDCAEVDVGEFTVRAEFGAPAGHPVVNSEPGKLVNVVIEQAYEAIVDGERFVALADTVTDSRTSCCIHTTCWGTNTRRSNQRADTRSCIDTGDELHDGYTHSLLVHSLFNRWT